MVRRRPPFEFTKKHGYRCNLDADERHLLRRLTGEVRELLATTSPEDPKMRRLFPPAYDRAVDADADAEYRRLMYEELVASRLESLATIENVLAEENSESKVTIDEHQLHALSMSLNSVRLILGTLLDITDDEESDLDDDVDDERQGANMALYHYLSWLLESAVSAMLEGLDRSGD